MLVTLFTLYSKAFELHAAFKTKSKNNTDFLKYVLMLYIE